MQDFEIYLFSLYENNYPICVNFKIKLLWAVRNFLFNFNWLPWGGDITSLHKKKFNIVPKKFLRYLTINSYMGGNDYRD